MVEKKPLTTSYNPIPLRHRRQHTSATKQPDNQRIHTPPVRGSDVEEDAAIRGHRRMS